MIDEFESTMAKVWRLELKLSAGSDPKSKRGNVKLDLGEKYNLKLVVA